MNFPIEDVPPPEPDEALMARIRSTGQRHMYKAGVWMRGRVDTGGGSVAVVED